MNHEEQEGHEGEKEVETLPILHVLHGSKFDLAKAGIPNPLCLPLDHRSCPRETASKDDEQDVFAHFHASSPVGFIQGYGNGCGARIAKTVEVDHETLHWNVHPIRNGLDNADVRLMRNDTRKIFGLQISLGQCPVGGIQHGCDSVFIGFFAVHPDAIQALIDIIRPDRGA